MDSSYTYQISLRLLHSLAPTDHYEAVLYQNMYFVFFWATPSPYYNRPKAKAVSEIGVSALMNALRGTWVDVALIS